MRESEPESGLNAQQPDLRPRAPSGPWWLSALFVLLAASNLTYYADFPIVRNSLIYARIVDFMIEFGSDFSVAEHGYNKALGFPVLSMPMVALFGTSRGLTAALQRMHGPLLDVVLRQPAGLLPVPVRIPRFVECARTSLVALFSRTHDIREAAVVGWGELLRAVGSIDLDQTPRLRTLWLSTRLRRLQIPEPPLAMDERTEISHRFAGVLLSGGRGHRIGAVRPYLDLQPVAEPR